MFAKLKKKIQEEGGTTPEKDRSFSGPGPGLASPVQKTPPGDASMLPLRKDSSTPEKDWMNASNSSLNEIGARESSQEEVLSLLMKRTDQVKKLENKISELAAVIKEKNRNIDSLEKTIENQAGELESRLEDMGKQQEASKEKMTEKFAEVMQKKEEALRQQIDAVKESKATLVEKLHNAEQYRDKFFKSEEANDEFQGFTKQELAKVKHMLINSQEELTKVKSELEEKIFLLSQATQKASSLDAKLQIVEKDFSETSTLSKFLEKKNLQLQQELDEMSTQKESISSQLSQKCNQLLSVQRSLADVEEKFDGVNHASEQHRIKMNKLLEEKDESISHLKERMVMLEKRIQDTSLCEDDRIKALEIERDMLEKKLQETRQMGSEMKVSMADHITSLEKQISHLNSKIGEDSDELQQFRQETENMRQSLKQQISELQTDLKSAKEHSLELQDLVSEKDALLIKQRVDLDAELSKSRSAVSQVESDLKSRLSTTQAQLMVLQKQLDADATASRQRISELESSQADALEKEIDTEKQVTTLEDEIHKLKAEVNQKEKERRQLSDKVEQLQGKLSSLSNEARLLESKSDNMRQEYNHIKKELHECNKEKDELLMRNAELSSAFESYKHEHTSGQRDLEAELQAKLSAIASLEAALQEQQQELDHLRSEGQKREQSALCVEEVDQLKTNVGDLEEQLADKNRTIKMQQQRLTDLKKTLQRELKVQSLPNDEAPDGAVVAESNSASTSHTKNDTAKVHSPQTLLHHSYNSTIHRADKFLPASMRADMRQMDLNPNSSSVMGQESTQLTEINLLYLKHVILKFMLSRESEALLLITAVSVLLRFSKDEQQLIRETLEYKMSWFGSRPKSGKGQLAKIIPPSY